MAIKLCNDLAIILHLFHPYQWQGSTAGLDLIFYVGHLSFPPHMATFGVTEVTGGVKVSIKLIQWVNAKS